MVDEIAHIIPTFERPKVAQRLVDSILHFYPESRIYVCDDSREPSTYDGATDVPATAYDIGLSAKRNLLVQASDEPLVFLWDDDYVCTSNTDFRVFYELLRSVENCGVVGAEWSLEADADPRNVWFTGTIEPDGATIRVRPPSGQPHTVDTEIGTLRYHSVDLLPNWFLAERETLEAVPWDEELKLNEHLEFFARLTALRADSRRGRRWRKRWERLQSGEPLHEIGGNGRIAVQAKGTFSNADKLSHVGGRVSTGDWVEVDADYAEGLIEDGLAVRLETEFETRPFPLPDVDDAVNLGCILTPETTCTHLREEGRTSEAYNEGRFRRETFMPLQKEKLGVSERDLVQWGKYPHDSPDFSQPDPQLLELP